MATILEKIIETKWQEIEAAKKISSLSVLKKVCETAPRPRDFQGAILKKLSENKSAVIAEIKKASPSKGVIRENFDPVAIAKSYEKGGATCLSVLTDEKYFQGSLHYLEKIHAVCSLPLLRKDFILDEYQIYETRAKFGDCILLIVAALTDEQLQKFSQLAKQLNLSVLIEVHDEAELKRALHLPVELLGINNRNLHTFHTDIQTTLSLLPLIPKDKIVVTESGIYTREDVQLMCSHHVNTFLIGEAFMREPDPGHALHELLGSDPN